MTVIIYASRYERGEGSPVLCPPTPLPPPLPLSKPVTPPKPAEIPFQTHFPPWGLPRLLLKIPRVLFLALVSEEHLRPYPNRLKGPAFYRLTLTVGFCEGGIVSIFARFNAGTKNEKKEKQSGQFIIFQGTILRKQDLEQVWIFSLDLDDFYKMYEQKCFVV